MRKLLLSFILLLSATLDGWAQRVEMDKKSGLITVDGRPSFYLTGRNRSVFLADYSLENLQHQELAYLKVLQQRVFTPGFGFGTETFYVVNFPSGSFCELHGLMGFSMFKALAKNIAAARLVQNDRIDPQAEQRFIRMNGGELANDRNGRRGEPAYEDRAAQQNRIPNNRGKNLGRDDDRYADDQPERRDDQREDRQDDDRNRENDQAYNDCPYDGDTNNVEGIQLPVNVSLEGNKIYENSELIGIYTKNSNNTTGEIVITIVDPEKRKIATARRNKGNWQLIMVDGVTLTAPYNAESPLVGLFTFIVEKEYL